MRYVVKVDGEGYAFGPFETKGDAEDFAVERCGGPDNSEVLELLVDQALKWRLFRGE